MKAYFELASRPLTLILTFATTVILLTLVFPSLDFGAELLDVRQGFSLEDVLTLMAIYGERGRLLYIWSSLMLDTILPLCYATFLTGILYRFRTSDIMAYLALVPVVAGITDLAENVQIVLMLSQFPEISESQVDWASLANFGKHGLTLLSVALALVVVAMSAVRRIKLKRRANR